MMLIFGMCLCSRTLIVKVQSHLTGINMPLKSMRYWWRRRLQMNSYMKGMTHTETHTETHTHTQAHTHTDTHTHTDFIDWLIVKRAKRCLQEELITSTMCVLSVGHSMMTTNPMIFKSPERSGIKWKSWSYQTCRHRAPALEHFGWMHPEIHGLKERERAKRSRCLFIRRLWSLTRNGVLSFLCVWP